ncbi:tetratricopeptide repeat protein [Nonomuraea sp. NPDC050783]|uniref:tetratricopeptide repeat protein n=1 Tax=Nonomuraea sp. NPDC050783 TaxID=3154634 RepID=UPI0034668957
MRHVWIAGERRADRLRAAAAYRPAIVAGCHQRLRGPYTGVDTVLRAVLPEAFARWPELVERHRVSLLYGLPELAEVIGPGPRQLAFTGPFEQRTRFYGAQMIRCVSQGVVTFLIEYARLADVPPVLVLDDLHAAEESTQELAALLLRRADPRELLVVAGSRREGVGDQLATALERYADPIEAGPIEAGPTDAGPTDANPPADPPVGPAADPAADSTVGRAAGPAAVGGPEGGGGWPGAELVRAFVWSDGTSDDPAELAAYEAADPALRRELHDRRAAELAPGAGYGLRMGAIPYHLERGGDPGGRGRAALADALRVSAEIGFSAATADFGLRGRRVTDPVAHPDDFRLFTSLAANALVPLHRLDESYALYMDLRTRYTDPRAHMITSYGIAMLYTRFFTPRDHETALAWQNNAVAISALLPDPVERTTRQVFNDNALALIEMHRGNLGRALELIEAGIARLDRELEPGDWVVHRSQLLYNRTRLLAALGRHEAAHEGFTRLIELDPYYTDYLSERARISRRRGDLAAALADYDRAVATAPPYPELYYNRGTCRVEAGDTAGALADFGHVLEMEPDDGPTLFRRAELLLDLGDLAAAEADVTAGLAARPGDAELLCLHGLIELERGEARRAADRLDAALATAPDYAAALVNRAVARFRLGRPEGAAEDLTRALELLGDDPDLLLNRGLAHEAAGRHRQALADFDAALSLPGADAAELEPARDRCRRLLAEV